MAMDEQEHMRPSKMVEEQRGRHPGGMERRFEALASKTSRMIGSSWSFGIAVGIVILWAVTGPIFQYSDTWQLVINTGTTIITFLMVFLLQHTQNKDGLAIQLKLDEIIASIEGASNHMIDIEDLSEQDLMELKLRYQKIVEQLSRRHARESFSVERDGPVRRPPTNTDPTSLPSR